MAGSAPIVVSKILRKFDDKIIIKMLHFAFFVHDNHSKNVQTHTHTHFAGGE